MVMATLVFGIPVFADVIPEPPKAGQFDVAPWPAQIPVVVEMESSGLARVEVTPPLYRNAGPDLSELRLVRVDASEYREQPWVVRKVPAPETPDTPRFQQETESFNPTSDGAIEIIVRLEPAPGVPLRLEVETPLRDFEKGVSISIPANDGIWEELVADGVLFDHSRFLDFRRTAIDLPRSGAGRFRIRIADATDLQRSRLREITRTVSDSTGVTISESDQVLNRDFRIDGFRFVPILPREKPKREEKEIYPLELLGQETMDGGVAAFEFDGGNFPLDRFRFETNDRNFRRAVSLQIPAGEGKWRTIHRGHLHRYEVGDFHDESLSLVLPETRAERYRLLVENGANPAIGIGSVSGDGPRYEVFFLAAPGKSLLFFTGAKGVEPSRLDDAAIQAAVSRKAPATTLTLGEAAPNPGFEKSAASAKSGFLESKPALWIAIAAAVAILIRVLYRALRKVEEETAG